MALQLTGAFKEEALANLQVELPAVVIGGGLTAIDTATELLAYYPLQAEKTLARYEALCGEHGEDDGPRALRPRGAGDPRPAARARPGGPQGARARAHAPGETPDLSRPLPGSGAASRSPTGARWRSLRRTASTTRRSSRRSRRASRSSRASSPRRRCPTSTASSKAVRFLRGGSGETVELPARTLPRRRRHDAQHHLRQGVPRRAAARREAALLRAPQGGSRR